METNFVIILIITIIIIIIIIIMTIIIIIIPTFLMFDMKSVDAPVFCLRRVYSWRNFWELNSPKMRRKFVFFRRRHRRWVSGATIVVRLETPASINIIFVFFSQRWGFIIHLDIARESHRRLHRSRWGNLYLCGLWQWRYILKLQYIRFAFFSLLTVVFLTPWFVNFFFRLL